MTMTATQLHRQVVLADELYSVVRTMKVMAAAEVSHYEQAIHALEEYDLSVQLGLQACFSQCDYSKVIPCKMPSTLTTRALVFGSDQGLVGQFNDVLVEFMLASLRPFLTTPAFWTIGTSINRCLEAAQYEAEAHFMLPKTLGSVASLVAELLKQLEHHHSNSDESGSVYLFYNSPLPGSIYQPTCKRLLPLDDLWCKQIGLRPWPSHNLPEVMPGTHATLRAFVREYLFVSLFRACAESLASENACRLAAMQRAEKNIDELQLKLNRAFNRWRQQTIDDELFDVISGFNAHESEFS